MARRLVLGMLIALTVAAEAPARDTRAPGLPRPNELRIEGFIGESPARAAPAAIWTLKCLGQTYRFTVTRLQVLVGDLSYMDVIEEARPYRIAFTLQGEPRTLQRFRDAAAGETISLIAYQRSGWRDLLVASITPVGAPTPAR